MREVPEAEEMQESMPQPSRSVRQQVYENREKQSTEKKGEKAA